MLAGFTSKGIFLPVIKIIYTLARVKLSESADIAIRQLATALRSN